MTVEEALDNLSQCAIRLSRPYRNAQLENIDTVRQHIKQQDAEIERLQAALKTREEWVARLTEDLKSAADKVADRDRAIVFIGRWMASHARDALNREDMPPT